jgi:hypothetical protein
MQAPVHGVIGWMDWPTGVQFIDLELEDPSHWPAVLQDDSERAREAMQTVSHETLHFLQVATTGFMYRWVCDHHRLVARAFKPLGAEVAAYLDDPGPKTLLAVEQKVDPAIREALLAHVAQLDRRGANRISVRYLLEAHALLGEMKIHWQGLDSKHILPLLGEQAAGPEYRLAYDLVRMRLGEGVAFRDFLLIASLALCADDPPQAFDELVDVLARRAAPEPSDGGAPDTDWVLAAAGVAISGFIGSSVQVLEADDSARHPIYTPALAMINEACGRGLRVVDFFGDPRPGLELIANEAVRPTVFRPTRSDQFPVIVPRRMKDAEVLDLLLMAVLASRVASAAPPGADEGDVPWAWLAEVRGDLLVLEVKPPQLQSRELGALAALDPAATTPALARKLCALWGRCALTFDLDDADAVWLRADVRAFVAALAKEQPAFPIYLDPDPDLGMFIVWFGALAEPEALHGTNLNLNHHSVVSQVMRAVEAISALAQGLGASAQPAVQRLLSPYPRGRVKTVLAALP